MRVLIAEYTASQVPLERFDEFHRRHAYSDKGKTFIPEVYQRATGDAEAGLRTNKIAELDPWDPEFWATQEEATLSEMRYSFAPQDIINLQMKQMIYLGDNQREVKEDADPEFARTLAEDERRAKRAARKGRPSSSDPEQTSVMNREEVLALAGDRADHRVGFRRKDDYWTR